MSENSRNNDGKLQRSIGPLAQREQRRQDAAQRMRIVGKLLVLMVNAERDPDILGTDEFLEIFEAFIRISFNRCPICGGPLSGRVEKAPRPIFGVNCTGAIKGQCIMTGITNLAEHAATNEPRFLTPAEVAGIWNSFGLESAIELSLTVLANQPFQRGD